MIAAHGVQQWRERRARAGRRLPRESSVNGSRSFRPAVTRPPSPLGVTSVRWNRLVWTVPTSPALIGLGTGQRGGGLSSDTDPYQSLAGFARLLLLGQFRLLQCDGVPSCGPLALGSPERVSTTAEPQAAQTRKDRILHTESCPGRYIDSATDDIDFEHDYTAPGFHSFPRIGLRSRLSRPGRVRGR